MEIQSVDDQADAVREEQQDEGSEEHHSRWRREGGRGEGEGGEERGGERMACSYTLPLLHLHFEVERGCLLRVIVGGGCWSGAWNITRCG